MRRARSSLPHGDGRLSRLGRAATSVLAVLALVALAASMSGVWPWRAGMAGLTTPRPTGVDVGPGAAGSRVPGASQPLPSPTGPVTVHVAERGSDNADGSEATPWRTLQHAVGAAPDGATIAVGAGTFPGFTTDRSAGLSIIGVPGETVIAGDATTADVIRLSGVHGLQLAGLTVEGASKSFGSGIRIDDGNDITIESSSLRNNRSFGIKIADSGGITVRGNDIGDNETGIEISRAGEGILVADNDIHDNDRMVTSSRGGNAIVFHLTTGTITVSGNRIWGNRAPHASDPGYDGGAFEVYGASNLVITGNVLWDNNNAMETGTDGVSPCNDNRFERNVVRGPGTVPGETTGLILRCAARMRVAHNTFDGVDDYAFYVTATGGYAGSIDGLTIVNNIVVRARAFSLAAGLPSTLVIDHDVVHPGGSSASYADRVAYVEGRGNTDSLAELRSWTGYEAHGLQVDPLFTDLAGGDYHLSAGSPAIDRGVDLGEPYAGAAPDPGRYEAGG